MTLFKILHLVYAHERLMKRSCKGNHEITGFNVNTHAYKQDAHITERRSRCLSTKSRRGGLTHRRSRQRTALLLLSKDMTTTVATPESATRPGPHAVDRATDTTVGRERTRALNERATDRAEPSTYLPAVSAARRAGERRCASRRTRTSRGAAPASLTPRPAPERRAALPSKQTCAPYGQRLISRRS